MRRGESILDALRELASELWLDPGPHVAFEYRVLAAGVCVTASAPSAASQQVALWAELENGATPPLETLRYAQQRAAAHALELHHFLERMPSATPVPTATR